MSPRKQRFVRLPVGINDRLRSRGVSGATALTYFDIRTHPAKRTIPALLNLGAAGLAESIDQPAAKTTQQLAELVSGGLLIFDQPN
jgi:hypothetical protein